MHLILFKCMLLACGLTLALAQRSNQLLPGPDECGVFNSSQYYNQATVTEIDEFPWIAGIVYDTDEVFTRDTKYRCLAILITSRYLVTLAHCMESPNNMAVAVVLGDWDTSSDPDCVSTDRCSMPVKRDIGDIIMRPDYQPNRDDIALLRLNEPIAFTQYIRPICLPEPDVSKMDFTTQLLVLTGFMLAPSVSTKRTKVFSPIWSFDECSSKYTHLKVGLMDTLNICASDCVNSSTFLSGSALMGVRMNSLKERHYYLVGLISRGIRQCSVLHPAVFARIDSHLEWINKNIY